MTDDSDHSTRELDGELGEDVENSLLPVHPHPIEGELLSSWMHRLATSLGMELPELWRWVRGNRQRSMLTDMDRNVSLELLDDLHRCTGVSRDTLWHLTLPALVPLIGEHKKTTSYVTHPTAWVGPTGYDYAGFGVFADWRDGRGPRPEGRYYGLVFCPDCLATDPRPYFRRTWRLAWSVVCVKHGIVLQDRCYRCGHPISFGRATRGGGPVRRPVVDRILRCAQCDAYRDEAPRVAASPNEVEHQRARDVVLQKKIAKLPHVAGSAAAPYYFAMLHSLCNRLSGPKSQDLEFQSAAYQWAHVRFAKPDWYTISHRVTSLTLPARRPALHVATAILAGWPHSFTEILWRLPNGPAVAADAFSFSGWLHECLNNSPYGSRYGRDDIYFSVHNAIRERLGLPIAEPLPIAERLDSSDGIAFFDYEAEEAVQMVWMHAPLTSTYDSPPAFR